MNGPKFSLSLILALLVSSIYSCKDDTYNPTPVIKPIIAGASPLTGTKGTEITIVGSNFSANTALNTVKINGKNATVSFASTTVLKCIVPAKAGTGNIVVVVNNEGTTGPVFNFIYTVSVSTYAGFSGSAGYVDGDVSVAKFNYPRGMAIDAQDNIYVADELNHSIRKVSVGGNVSTFTGSGVAGFLNGDPAVAKFRNPFDVELDPINGVFYVADKSNHCIRRLSLTGYATTAAGIPNTPGYVDAPGASARFNNPTGVAVRGELADVYVTDGTNHCIRKIDYLDIVTTLAGSSVPGQQDGSGASAKFTTPSGICWDSTGFLYVTDSYNNNIRKVSNSGNVTTVAGTGFAGWVDGPGALAQFNGPIGILSDGGSLKVCDVINQRIRGISIAKEVSTIAGTALQGFGDGAGDVATFKNPSGIIKNSEGDYFIADTGNHSIRKIVID
ncbi:MAG: IPT/TIG domain-containing protein [Bacteroidetes bacterium]|nr:IPT/TIG domain-containing protein [Bacteroidota bacterium]